jgi:hypothetical protein
MKNILILALLFSLPISGLMAQEEKEIEKVISTLFEGMKAKDGTKVKELFHTDASMQTVLAGENGASLGSNSVSDFITRISTTPEGTVLDERILEYEIKVDGQMASAWTPYEFYVSDTFSHCGVNSFQLIKTSDGWKITYVIDTRRKEGCN